MISLIIPPKVSVLCRREGSEDGGIGDLCEAQGQDEGSAPSRKEGRSSLT